MQISAEGDDRSHIQAKKGNNVSGYFPVVIFHGTHPGRPPKISDGSTI